VCGGFLSLVAKLMISIILPYMTLKPIRRPQFMFKHEPNKNLAFRGGLRFPHTGGHNGVGESLKLHLYTENKKY
jgi:hypothetical protein